ncbi:MAG: murein biosynthesis integral membrane protein MurJ [Acidimicrobiales bacterium]
MSTPQGSFRRNTAVMAAGTTLSRLTGFARLVALAYALGFTRLTDTYNLANVTPNIIYELVLGGILSATLVPLFVEKLAGVGHPVGDGGDTEETDEEAWRAVSAVMTVVGAVAVAVTVLFALVAPMVVRLYTVANDTGSADEQQRVATLLLRMFAPQVAFYAMVSVATAVLNARRRFAVAMFAPVLNNLIVIGVLLALPHVASDLSLVAVGDQPATLALLGLGTTAGVAAMALVLLPSLRRTGARLRPVWDPGHPAVRQVLRLSGWTVGFVAANQVALWVALALANGRRGDVAAYQAALVFFLLPHGIFAVSVATALQPELAERWSVADVAAFRRQVALGLRTTAAIVVPAAVGYVVLGRPIVESALGHGALTADSARTTASILGWLALGLPAFSLWYFVIRVYQAMQDTRTIFRLYLVENAVNIGLAVALYPSMGVQGLALSYSAAYSVGVVVALAHLRSRIGGIEGTAVARSLARTAVASAAMATCVVAVAVVVGPAVAKVGCAVVVGLASYLAVGRALGMAEMRTLAKLRRG